MMSRRSIVLALTAAMFAGANLPTFAASRANPVKMFDTDNDGTLDLAEVKKAASALFAKLDRDHDGTLTIDEYLAVVERRFNAANPDKDGNLDAKELNNRAGQALLRLLK